jgi:hypothetical protein
MKKLFTILATLAFATVASTSALAGGGCGPKDSGESGDNTPAETAPTT